MINKVLSRLNSWVVGTKDHGDDSEAPLSSTLLTGLREAEEIPEFLTKDELSLWNGDLESKVKDESENNSQKVFDEIKKRSIRVAEKSVSIGGVFSLEDDDGVDGVFVPIHADLYESSLSTPQVVIILPKIRKWPDGDRQNICEAFLDGYIKGGGVLEDQYFVIYSLIRKEDTDRLRKINLTSCTSFGFSGWVLGYLMAQTKIYKSQNIVCTGVWQRTNNIGRVRGMEGKLEGLKTYIKTSEKKKFVFCIPQSVEIDSDDKKVEIKKFFGFGDFLRELKWCLPYQEYAKKCVKYVEQKYTPQVPLKLHKYLAPDDKKTLSEMAQEDESYFVLGTTESGKSTYLDFLSKHLCEKFLENVLTEKSTRLPIRLDSGDLWAHFDELREDKEVSLDKFYDLLQLPDKLNLRVKDLLNIKLSLLIDHTTKKKKLPTPPTLSQLSLLISKLSQIAQLVIASDQERFDRKKSSVLPIFMISPLSKEEIKSLLGKDMWSDEESAQDVFEHRGRLFTVIKMIEKQRKEMKTAERNYLSINKGYSPTQEFPIKQFKTFIINMVEANANLKTKDNAFRPRLPSKVKRTKAGNFVINVLLYMAKEECNLKYNEIETMDIVKLNGIVGTPSCVTNWRPDPWDMEKVYQQFQKGKEEFDDLRDWFAREDSTFFPKFMAELKKKDLFEGFDNYIRKYGSLNHNTKELMKKIFNDYPPNKWDILDEYKDDFREWVFQESHSLPLEDNLYRLVYNSWVLNKCISTINLW